MPSTFQTRHYEAIASVLIRAKAGVVFSTGLRAPDEILDVLDHMTDDLAAMFAQDNPNFDPMRFVSRINAS